jgi:thiamine-phosphate pyrophosphorylase
MKRRLPPKLVALSPGELAAEGEGGAEKFLSAARAATGAGLRGILLREPERSDRALLELGVAVRRILGEEGWLAIHDRVHLAEACGADAVHLGFRSLAPKTARPILSNGITIGFSAHAGDAPGLEEGADYLFLGPVLDTPSKRGVKEPIGFEGLAEEIAKRKLPVWAIGGLRSEHTARCLEAGVSGIAVLSGLLRSTNPAPATRAYLQSLGVAT